MRLVKIVNQTYTVFEGRTVVAEFVADAPLPADMVEELRVGDFSTKESA